MLQSLWMGGTNQLNCIAPAWVLSMELDLDLRPELDSKTKKTCQCSLRRSMVCVWMCVTRKWYLFFVRANWDCRYWLNPEPVQNGLTRQHITKYPLTNGWYEVLKKLQTVQTPGNMHHIHCVQIFTQICKKIGNDDSWWFTNIWPRSNACLKISVYIKLFTQQSQYPL